MRFLSLPFPIFSFFFLSSMLFPNVAFFPSPFWASSCYVGTLEAQCSTSKAAESRANTFFNLSNYLTLEKSVGIQFRWNLFARRHAPVIFNNKSEIPQRGSLLRNYWPKLVTTGHNCCASMAYIYIRIELIINHEKLIKLIKLNYFSRGQW